MLILTAKIREEKGKKTNKLREKGIVPAVLYGPKVKNILLEVDLKEFDKVHKEAGESSLIKLKVDKNEYLVLIYALEIDFLSQQPIHIDFYQPKLDEEITATVTLVFEGEAPAVKNLNGTLVRNMHEIEVKALPEKLPHEIKIDISVLETFAESITVQDLVVPEGVEVLKEAEEVIVFVAEPVKVEEKLAEEIEGDVEDVEKVEKDKEEGEKEEKEEEAKEE